jgi:hypothetical protein
MEKSADYIDGAIHIIAGEVPTARASRHPTMEVMHEFTSLT